MKQLPLPLLLQPEPQSVPINGRCTLRTQQEWRVVSVGGLPIHHYRRNDRVAEAYAMVCLVRAGFATRVELARAFGCSSRTVRRHLRRYAAHGMAGLDVHSGRKAGELRLSRRRLAVVSRLKASGDSNREIARQLDITENAIREVVCRWIDPKPEPQQLCLPGFPSPPARPDPAGEGKAPPAARQRPSPRAAASADKPAPTLDRDPTDRWMDRFLAAIGLLDDAAPLFRSGERIPHAGVLLAVPPLVASGIFAVAKEVYADLAPAFYGLRTTVLVLLLMALLRLKRPEYLKEHSPPDLGGIFGLDRAPEVKTLRRKLARLAKAKQAERFGRLLAKRRVAARGRVLGFLYVDGHVRVYHGKHRIPKAHVAQMRMALPATTDYWVNDRRGDPLLVVTAEANQGLVQILPLLTQEIRALVGKRRRVTILFDRGGWSPKLFKRLIDDRFDILTYRKKPMRLVPRQAFVLCRERIEGRRVEYRLDDRNIRLLKGRLGLRQVTRLSEDGRHQTAIVTSRRDLSAVHVAYRMFNRWRQENFFKYMSEEFLFDALVDYSVEPADPGRTVPNPERHKLDDRLRETRQQLAKLQQSYGVAALRNPEGRRPTMRGFKIAHGKVGRAMRAIDKRIAALRAKKRVVPARVPVERVYPGKVVKLSTERKHLTNLIKMVAYQAESDLLALVRPRYARADEEGRTLIQSALVTTAELRVEDAELRVTLDPLSSPHRTRAIEALCEALNRAEVCFPGTELRLRYAVRPNV
jgi:DNA-binding CsgD family transcriptional regulator